MAQDALIESGPIDYLVVEFPGNRMTGEGDPGEAARVLEPGNSAGILVDENSWAVPFAAALRRGGAQVVASGRVLMEDLERSLEALDEPG